jgi:hypothetical protein
VGGGVQRVLRASGRPSMGGGEAGDGDVGTGEAGTEQGRGGVAAAAMCLSPVGHRERDALVLVLCLGPGGPECLGLVGARMLYLGQLCITNT